MSFAQVVTLVTGFVATVAQTRLLGPGGRGEVVRFANLTSLAVLYLGFGIAPAIVYFVSSRAVPLGLLRRRLTVVLAAASALLLLLGMGVSSTSLRGVAFPSVMPGPVALALVVFFFACSQLSAWLSAYLTAEKRFGAVNAAGISVGVLGATVSVALFFLRPGWMQPVTVIGVVTSLELLRAVLLATSAASQARTTRAASSIADGTPNLDSAAVVRYSFLSYVGEAIQFLTYRFDMWVVDYYFGAAELGLYALAVTLAQLVWIVPASTASVLFPYIPTMDRSEAAAFTRMVVARIILLALLLGGGGLACAHVLVAPVFGPAFSGVPSLIGILLIGIVPYSAAKVFGNYLAGINALGASVLLSLAGLGVAVLLDLWWIPRYGATGAAWATAVSYPVYTLLLFGLFLVKSRRGLARAGDSPRTPSFTPPEAP